MKSLEQTFPLIQELQPLPDSEEAFLHLAAYRHCIFFDSARRHATLGRYSFLAADPFDYLEFPADGTDAIGELARRLARFPAHRLLELPPFQGGAAGLISYDLGRAFERLPQPAFDEFKVPALAVGLYDVVLAIDHVAGRAWIISQGFPETEPTSRKRRARERLTQFHSWLTQPRPQQSVERSATCIPIERLAPQFAIAAAPNLTSNFDRR
jgi:para-aminobenzoate synthetase component 1